MGRPRGCSGDQRAVMQGEEQLHDEQWLEYLECLKATMIPDTRSNFEHFQMMDRRVFLPEFQRDQKFSEIKEHEHFVKKNLAGIAYMERDSFYLNNWKNK